MTNKKPIKVSNGDFITGSNFEKLYFTEKQAISFIKKRVAERNKRLAKLNNTYRYKFVGLKDCGKYWTYTIV